MAQTLIFQNSQYQSPLLQMDYHAQPYFQSFQQYDLHRQSLQQEASKNTDFFKQGLQLPGDSSRSISTSSVERDDDSKLEAEQSHNEPSSNKITIPMITRKVRHHKQSCKSKIKKNLLNIASGDLDVTQQDLQRIGQELNNSRYKTVKDFKDKKKILLCIHKHGYQKLRQHGINLQQRTINRWARNSPSQVKLNLGRPVVDPQLERNTMGMIKELNKLGFRVNKPLIQTVQNHYGRAVPLKSASHFYKFNKRFDKYLKNQAHHKFKNVSTNDIIQVLWKLRQVSGLYHDQLGKLLTKQKPTQSEWRRYFFKNNVPEANEYQENEMRLYSQQYQLC